MIQTVLFFAWTSSRYLPYIWLLIMPFYVSVFGVEAIIRLSLTFYVFIVITSLFTKLPGCASTVIDAVIFVLIIVNPVAVIPSYFLRVYEILLIISQPILLMFEVVQIVNLSCWISQRIVNQVDDHPFFAKSSILLASGATYVLSARLFFTLLTSSSYVLTRILWILLIFNFVIFVYVVLLKDEGVISDVAAVFLVSLASLYVMKYEMNLSHDGFTPLTSNGGSFLSMLIDVPSITFDRSSQSLILIRRLFNPLFWSMTVVRVLSIVQFLRIILSDYFTDDDYQDDFHFEETIGSAISYWLTDSLLRTNVLLKISAVFAYTQLIYVHVTNAASSEAMIDDRGAWPICDDVMPTRIIQCFFIGAYYMWGVYHQSDADSLLDNF